MYKSLRQLLLLLVVAGCASRDAEKRARYTEPPSVVALATGEAEPPTPEEVGEQLQGAVHHWFFGKGFGTGLLNISSIVIFPPYALYLLVNAGVKMCGYEPYYVTDLMPEEPRKEVLTIYDAIVSAPGRAMCVIADEEFTDEPATPIEERL